MNSPKRRESRPAGNGTASQETHAGQALPILAEMAPGEALAPERHTVDLARMTPRAQDIWLEAYELGAAAGWADGYAAAEADMAELHRRAHAVVQQAAKAGPFADLCDARGEHDRAQAVRADLARRGVTAA